MTVIAAVVQTMLILMAVVLEMVMIVTLMMMDNALGHTRRYSCKDDTRDRAHLTK